MHDDKSPGLEAVEALAADAAPAPDERVSLNDLKAEILTVRYFNLGDAIDATLGETANLMWLCVITTRSGFNLIGKSAPLSAANYDPYKGRTLAYEDALKQLWPLMAFVRLQDKLKHGKVK